MAPPGQYAAMIAIANAPAIAWRKYTDGTPGAALEGCIS